MYISSSVELARRVSTLTRGYAAGPWQACTELFTPGPEPLVLPYDHGPD
jgi:hypothetical protein